MERLHEDIAAVCVRRFNSLPKTGRPNHDQWTVLACIVEEKCCPGAGYEVVALGTGSKCIGRSQLSPNGDILNDSHAEVVCRRSFLRYLYQQLVKRDGIFSFDADSQKYVLKDRAFHFFTTHVPCGDAAIFAKETGSACAEYGEVIGAAKRPADDAGAVRKRLKTDTYRTGAKCLAEGEEQDPKSPGIDYHAVRVVRTKPGRGDPTLSVSCSDKLARWCHLGLEGALLASLIATPVRFKSFTIAGGTPFDPAALTRALYTRIAPHPTHEKVIVGQASITFEFSKTGQKQPCPSSVAWSNVPERPFEVAIDGKRQGATKKDRNTKRARMQICKMELFRTYVSVVRDLQLDLFPGCDLNDICYEAAKARAVVYQESWMKLKRDGFKVWTVKDRGRDLDGLCYEAAKTQAVGYQKKWLKLKLDEFEVWLVKDRGLLNFMLD